MTLGVSLLPTMVHARHRLLVRLVFSRHFSDSCKNGRRAPAYFHNPGTEPLRAITTAQLIDLAAKKYPTRPAIVSLHEDKTLTFADVKHQAEQFGASLLKLGLKPGDRIGCLGANSIHWYLTMQAAAKAGLILVTVNPAYRAMELGMALQQVGCRALVTDHRFKSQNYPELLAEVAPSFGSSPHGEPLRCPQLPELEFVIVATEEKLPGCYRLKDVIEMADSLEKLKAVEERIQPDDPSCIQFSSGTTGRPKACVLSHFGTINNGHFFGKRCGFDKKHHTLCLQVPMFHIFGSTLGILCSLDHGNTLVLPGPSFKKDDTIKALLRHRCNVIYGTPTMYVDVCTELRVLQEKSEAMREACSEFEVVVSGGAICTPALFKDIADTFKCTNVQSAFGLTETSPICMTNTRYDTFEQRTTTVGFCADHLEVKVVDPEGRMVEFGQPGEAWYRSYANMLGYWGDELRTREAINSAGWLKSGDTMILTEDGYGRIIGRIKDIIIRGGENIFPSEIEQFLQKHPDILDIQVYGVADKRLGEDVAASVLLSESSQLTESGIQAYCKGKIAHFKIPKYIRFVNDFPKTSSGKIRKNVLRRIHEEELGVSEI